MKLFIHEILPPSVERTIFIDTDAFFISDPTQLWDQFDSLEPGVAISMPYHPDQYEPSWHHANRICSCIMLLDLARLRDLRLMDSVHYREDSQAARIRALATPAFEAMYGKPVLDADSGRMKYDDVKLGDQGYWWAIVSHRPEIFKHLSFDWEMSSCLMDLYNTGLGDDAVDEQTEARWQVHTDDTPEAGRAVLPKMLHLYVVSRGFTVLRRADRFIATAWMALTATTIGLAGQTRTTHLHSAGALLYATTSVLSGSGSISLRRMQRSLWRRCMTSSSRTRSLLRCAVEATTIGDGLDDI